MGNSTLKFQQKPRPFNFQRAPRPHAIKQSPATPSNPPDKGPLTTMQNPSPVALTNSEKRERDLRDIFWQKMSRRSHAFLSEPVTATKNGPHGGKQSPIEGTGQHSQNLPDNM